MRVVFFGTPDFAAFILKQLLRTEIDVVAVITRPDKPQGRGRRYASSAVKRALLALNRDIPLYQPEKVSDLSFLPVLESFKADLFIVVAYGEILKQHVLDVPQLGCLNVHASLLPKYRGAAPMQRALMEGERETGVTIMRMVRKMDAGAVIRAGKTTIDPNETCGELEVKLCRLGADLLLNVIEDFKRGDVKETSQNEGLATYAPKIEPKDRFIDWSKEAVEVHNLIRGLSPSPGAYCFVREGGQRKRLKILLSERICDLSASPGKVIEIDKSGLTIGCGKGAVKILSLQIEGGRGITPWELMRGRNLIFD